MRYMSLWMVFRDPPEHTRLRRLVGTVFNLKALEGLAGPVAGSSTTCSTSCRPTGRSTGRSRWRCRCRPT